MEVITQLLKLSKMDVGYRLHCTFNKSHPSLGILNTPQTVGLWKLVVLEISVFEQHSSALINSLPKPTGADVGIK